MNSKTFFEDAAFEKGYRCIAGVDEAGRGSLAGPVVAAACVIPHGMIIDGVDDSKKLCPSQRQDLYYRITGNPHIIFGIGMVDNDHIDKTNILCASLHAMSLSIQDLHPVIPDYLLVDGNHLPPIRIPSQCVIKGDALSQSIGAASILAKYTRDSLMKQFHNKWSCYGFDRNNGYGTKNHREALKVHGPSPIHRYSFQPIKSMSIKKPHFVRSHF